ncbi:SDR family oxidoreductase [Defluviimonas sp. WL0075]|uniref:SDR family oxidoreductase n=1 Tax=Albidovulum sediminicola TaxID=2984331 RepID=A0ABT2YZM2_9RHOB|nr:SDR family oxidoreductase [Defluviimonas sp. WL0075]MCV2864326.1 SDR family oxidoreductase [Defluviimonas sp. WL0075]
MSARVVITAGASGIGLAMARAFQARGDRVWVTDVDEAALAAVPDGIVAARVDASDDAQMGGFFKEVSALWGGLDVLCANAGIKGPTAAIEDMDLAQWRDCLAVNLDGAMLAAKHATPLMKAQRSGVMTFTSSTAGLYGFPYRAPYAAAKWAVIGLMKTVAMELGPFGIRANAICPGSVNGPRIDRVFEAEAAAKDMTPDAVRAGYAAGTALGLLSDAEDIANMAVFLASEGARMVSGQVMTVDGFTINPDPKV